MCLCRLYPQGRDTMQWKRRAQISCKSGRTNNFLTTMPWLLWIILCSVCPKKWEARSTTDFRKRSLPFPRKVNSLVEMPSSWTWTWRELSCVEFVKEPKRSVLEWKYEWKKKKIKNIYSIVFAAPGGDSWKITMRLTILTHFLLEQLEKQMQGGAGRTTHQGTM